MDQQKQEVIGREFRFAYHIPADNEETPDYHFVKEQVHYKVGDKIEIKPEMRLIKNFKRPVYFTRANLRVYKEKKEFEKIENLTRKDVRQSELRKTVAQMVGKPWSRESLRELCGSPYVYGADIPSTLILRKTHYEDKYKNLISPRTVAMFDTETDMHNGIGDIIIGTACFNQEVLAVVQKRMLVGYSNPSHYFNEACSKYLKEHIEKHNLQIKFVIVDSEIDLIRLIFKQFHVWRPDFLAIWNMNFDIPKVLAACERARVDPKDILCDPNIPEALRICKYKEGSTKKVTASGKMMPIKPANQWHTLELTASFYVIDAMCVYRRIRGGAELVSYGLDAILDKELKLTKLKIPGAEKYKKGKWHAFMQKNMIFDYIAYGIFDSFSMLLLDLQTKDLSRTLSYLSELTSFADYASQTKRLRDNFYVFASENLGLILGSLGPKPKEEKKKEIIFEDDDAVILSDDIEEEEETKEDTTLDRRNWVITLRAFMSVLGLQLIDEDPNLHTLIRAFVYDSDVVSSYPNCTLVANVSKQTTRKEIIRIGDVAETDFRMQNLNFVFGVTNALEYSQVMFNLPTFTVLNDLFQASLRKEQMGLL